MKEEKGEYPKENMIETKNERPPFAGWKSKFGCVPRMNDVNADEQTSSQTTQRRVFRFSPGHNSFDRSKIAQSVIAECAVVPHGTRFTTICGFQKMWTSMHDSATDQSKKDMAQREDYIFFAHFF